MECETSAHPSCPSCTVYDVGAIASCSAKSCTGCLRPVLRNPLLLSWRGERVKLFGEMRDIYRVSRASGRVRTLATRHVGRLLPARLKRIELPPVNYASYDRLINYRLPATRYREWSSPASAATTRASTENIRHGVVVHRDSHISHTSGIVSRYLAYPACFRVSIEIPLLSHTFSPFRRPPAPRNYRRPPCSPSTTLEILAGEK